MTISDVFTVLGAGAGILLLALMAATPLLLALPLPRRSGADAPVAVRPTILIPAQRVAGERGARHSHAGAA
ncbi:hypothetical protein [Pseudonocardia sp. GCM10023141]|uniref:hypothetical protein n=1 Tax=Pseudonocardia sp. GCM10023141 TaxID=3252653 RepID=UPI00361A1291